MRLFPLLALLCGLLTLGARHAAAQTYTGELAEGDARLNSGEYVDWYIAEVSVGDTLVIDMLSLSNLNPYLLLRGPNSQDRDNDDAATGDTRRSHIEYVVTAGGTFQVGATSYEPGEVGAYTVSIDVLGGSGGAEPESTLFVPDFRLVIGSVWWNRAWHEAQEVHGVGPCPELREELGAAYQAVLAEVRATAGDASPDEVLREAARLAPRVVTEEGALPSGECVAVGHYADDRVYTAAFVEWNAFFDGFRWLGH